MYEFLSFSGRFPVRLHVGLTHSLSSTHSLTHSLTHPFPSHSLTHPLTLTHPPAHALTPSLTHHSLAHSLALPHSLSHSLAQCARVLHSFWANVCAAAAAAAVTRSTKQLPPSLVHIHTCQLQLEASQPARKTNELLLLAACSSTLPEFVTTLTLLRVQCGL